MTIQPSDVLVFAGVVAAFGLAWFLRAYINSMCHDAYFDGIQRGKALAADAAAKS